jgi:antitoxin HicB
MSFYRLRLEPDGDTVLVRSPDFPEIVTFGESRDDALIHVRDALEEAIAARIAHNEDIPPPLDKPDGDDCIELPVMVRLKSALYMILRRRNLTRADLQRLMQLPHREQVDRLLRLDHNSNIETMAQAFKALGAPLEIRILEAA